MSCQIKHLLTNESIYRVTQATWWSATSEAFARRQSRRKQNRGFLHISWLTVSSRAGQTVQFNKIQCFMSKHTQKHTHGLRAAVTFHPFLRKMWESCEDTWDQEAEQTAESSDPLFVVLPRLQISHIPCCLRLADDITRSAQPVTSPRTQTQVHGLFVWNVCVCRVARAWISSPLPGEYVCMSVYLHRLLSTW